MERNTSQKQIIKDYLKNVYTHPSAEEVYLAVQKKLPRISKATVYRILKRFTEQSLIQEIIVDNVSHFDGDLSAHSHFICNKCHQVFDVFEDINLKHKKNIKVGKISNYQIYFYGICNKCLSTNKPSKFKK